MVDPSQLSTKELLAIVGESPAATPVPTPTPTPTADLSGLSNEQLLAAAGGGGGAAAEPSMSYLFDELGAIGGKGARGVGDTLEFLHNINPTNPGGAPLWGLNPLSEKLMPESMKEPSQQIQDIGAAVGLEGEPKTAPGKLLGGMAYYAPDLLFGGKNAVKSVVGAGLTSGTADILGGGEGSQGLAGAVGGLIPSAGKFVKWLTGREAKQFEKAALRMSKGTVKKTTQGLSRSTRAELMSGEELPIEQVTPKMRERGVLKGSLEPNEMIARNEKKIIEYSDEAGGILSDADKAGKVHTVDDIDFDATAEVLKTHKSEIPAARTQIQKLLEPLGGAAVEEGDEVAEAAGFGAKYLDDLDLKELKWDGTLTGLNDYKKTLYRKLYKSMSEADSVLVRKAIAHDIKTFIEKQAKGALGDDAMDALVEANKKTGEHLQFYDILENVRLEEGKAGGFASFVERAAKSPIGLPAAGTAYGAAMGSLPVLALTAGVVALGATRRGQFGTASALRGASKLASPFAGDSIAGAMGSLSRMSSDEFLNAMEQGWEQIAGPSTTSTPTPVPAPIPEPEPEPKKKSNMREAPPKLRSLIEEVAFQHGMDPDLVQATIEQESDYDPLAVGPKTKYGHAVGLMQLLPSTAKWQAGRIGKKDFDLKNSRDNLELGVSYLKYLLDKFGDEHTALTAYHTGEGNVQKGKIGPIGKKYANQVLNRMKG